MSSTRVRGRRTRASAKKNKKRRRTTTKSFKFGNGQTDEVIDQVSSGETAVREIEKRQPAEVPVSHSVQGFTNHHHVRDLKSRALGTPRAQPPATCTTVAPRSAKEEEGNNEQDVNERKNLSFVGTDI